MGRHEEALKILHGGTVIPAIPLVLDENRKFNEAGQRTLIRYYLDAGGVGWQWRCTPRSSRSANRRWACSSRSCV